MRAVKRLPGLAVAAIALGALASCAQPPPPPPPAPVAMVDKADRVLVLKNHRKLYLMRGEHVLHSFPIALGRFPNGHKTHEGDERTPEGTYLLDWRNPNSRFYRSIHISYPNEQDVAQARARGVSPGGDIMIHGLPNGHGHLGATHAAVNWTDGCIAVTNEEMDVIWRMVEDNTPIEIRP